MNQALGSGKPQRAILRPGRVWLRYSETLTAGHAVGLTQQHVIQRLSLLRCQFFQLLSLHADDSARGGHPQKSLTVIEHGENGVVHHAVRRVQVNRMVALEPVQTSAFGAHPYIPGVVDRDRQHIGMGKPFYHADLIAHHAIQSRRRAHQNRTIVTLRQAGDQFVFQQENAFVLCWNSVCVVQQSGVRTHPKAATPCR